MKRILLLIICTFLILGFSACGNENEQIEPGLSNIQSVCKLASTEYKFHNVADGTKDADTGLFHIFDQDKKYFIEYSGSIVMGIDMLKVDMTIDNSDSDNPDVVIILPNAEILSSSIDEESIQDPIISGQGFLDGNSVDANDIKDEVATAQSNIINEFNDDPTYAYKARERAKSLIENYISHVSELSGKNYNIIWQDAE